jgi:site-specific DNA-methyltransferase (adenine-specific)
VLDPFSGSSTTLVVAKKLKRQFFGFELSEDYVAQGTARLASAKPGSALLGSEEPKVSAPATGEPPNAKQKTAKKRSTKKSVQKQLKLNMKLD